MSSHNWPWPRWNGPRIPLGKPPHTDVSRGAIDAMVKIFHANRRDGGTTHNSRIVAACHGSLYFNLESKAALAAIDSSLAKKVRK